MESRPVAKFPRKKVSTQGNLWNRAPSKKLYTNHWGVLGFLFWGGEGAAFVDGNIEKDKETTES